MYTIRFDGGSSGNPGVGGSGAVIIENSSMSVVSELALGHDMCTNNEAEYYGLLIALEEAVNKNYPISVIEGDSLLVINQILGKWAVNAKNLKPLYVKCKSLLVNFPGVLIRHIPREQNKLADALSWLKRPSI